MKVCKSHYISCIHNVHIIIYTERVSQFRLNEVSVTVREGASEFVLVCITMVSNGPLLEDVFFTISAENGSALGKLAFLLIYFILPVYFQSLKITQQ